MTEKRIGKYLPVLKRHSAILSVAVICALILCNFTEDISTDIIKASYSGIVKRDDNLILVDESGIPTVDYGYVEGVYIGKQKNPVTTSQKGLSYHYYYQKGDESARQLFLNCADWLVDNAVSYDNYSLLEYDFQWPKYDMTSPWRSSMAQGQALQVLIAADALTGDEKYLDCAKSLLNSFFVEVADGGVTYKSERDGWWYEEYADEGGKESRVLNGMMFAVLGIYDYYEYTGDEDALFLFNQGVTSLERNIHRYDNNGDSYYDILGNPSLHYHSAHIYLLDRLYTITNIDTFKEYRDKWENYEDHPFTVQLFLSPTKMRLAIFAGNLIAIFLALEFSILVLRKGKKLAQKRQKGTQKEKTSPGNTVYSAEFIHPDSVFESIAILRKPVEGPANLAYMYDVDETGYDNVLTGSDLALDITYEND
ncbi:MAG: hypothetical protein JSW28_08735 [Thermoplasmata archaeon]|nr:MAG: hypothetical protein JSW28_08735 [Thermoplasmata archaeon]